MNPGYVFYRLLWRWLLLWLTPGLLLAQQPTATLTGQVTDAKTSKPLPFAAVFLNASTKGTTTDEAGNYRLTAVPLGTIEIVTSFIGYETHRQTIRLDQSTTQKLNISLISNGLTLADVTVKAQKDKTWQRQFSIFERELIGNSPFATQCHIVNGHAVNFDEQDKHLKATATEPLIIENKALGYRIIYNMQHFDFTFSNKRYDYAYTTRFEELTPANDRERRRWERNRFVAYQGSQRHLMASFTANTLEAEGFLVYRLNRKWPLSTYQKDISRRLVSLTGQPLIQPARLPFERQLVLREPIVVLYTRINSPTSPYRDMPFAYSEIELPANGYSFIEITTDGQVTKPNGMLSTGYLSHDRLSTLLPADWTPTKSDEIDRQLTPTEGLIMAPDRRLDSLNQRWTATHRYQAPTAFLQTDKPFYLTGDQVWISAFMLDAISHQLTVGNDAIHLDLVSPTGKTIWHQWTAIANGRATANFRLSDTLVTGNYQLRAYTDIDRLAQKPTFERHLAVYNYQYGEYQSPVSTSSPSTGTTQQTTISKPLASGIDMQFLPEGGHWVAGLPARLGIKAIGSNGRGVAASGRILDSQGNEVSRFQTNRFGMGSIRLTPQRKQTYRAEGQAGNQSISALLPTIDSTGLVLAIDAVRDSNAVTVQVFGNGVFQEKPVYVLVQSRGQVVYQQKIQLVAGKARLLIPTNGLPAGLCHITLIDTYGNPRAERLIFAPEQRPALSLKISPAKARFTPREQVSLALQLSDTTSKRPVGFMSVAILDAAQVTNDTANADIRAHLLLTGDLRGYVEQPNFYFSQPGPEVRQALDELLITQGWRRLSWQLTSQLDAADTLAGMVIAGQVADDLNKPIPYAEILFTGFSKSGTITRSVGADIAGEFRLGGLFLADTIQMIGQVMDARLKAIKGHLKLEKPGQWFTNQSTIPTADWHTLRKYLDLARQRQDADLATYRDPRAKLLKEVTVKAPIIDDRPAYVRSISLHGKPDATVLFTDKSPRYSNLYEMLMGQVSGVSVVKDPPPSIGYKVNVRGAMSYNLSTQPLYLVDGITIQDTDGQQLLMFNAMDVERIEVLKGPSAAMYGSRGANGVIAFYQKRGNASSADAKPGNGINTFTFVGLPTAHRDFYLPRYEGSPEADSPIDRRDVLYWKPLMQTDSKGQSVVAFPLSDVAGTIQVVVQGITADGRPISSVQRIQVQ